METAPVKIAKYALIALIALGGGAAIYKSGYWRDAAPSGKAVAQQGPGGARAALVRIEKSAESTFVDTVQAVGTTRARRTIDVVPMVAGRVEAISFAAGDRVEAGAALVRLDDRTQQANLREARVGLDEARNAYERSLSLSGQNFTTKASLEQARSAFERAKSAVDRAEEELSDRAIKAPFAGVIGMAKVDHGARIDSDTVIAPLDDLAEVEVEFQIPEIFYPGVPAGRGATARSDAFDAREFAGSVTAIDSRINPASRAFSVRATIANPDLALRAGMFMHIALVLDTRLSVSVPEEAIVTENSETYVYLVADNKAVRRQVTLGKRLDGAVEVVSGVNAGEDVISSGVQNVDDGGAVQIIESEERRPEQRPRTG
jgi:membrane fusion protein (multidrug efflux system)